MPVHVFVYGTLRAGQYYRPLIDAYVAGTEPARAFGLLYDLGPYPAMIAERANLNARTGDEASGQPIGAAADAVFADAIADIVAEAAANIVTGELLRLRNPQEAIRVMDEIEQYYGPGDSRNEYERIVVRVSTATGADIDCYCYSYAQPQKLPLIGKRIPGGDWLRRHNAAATDAGFIIAPNSPYRPNPE